LLVRDAGGSEVCGLLCDVWPVGASRVDPVTGARARVDRIERVHLRDAVAGDLNVGIGRGDVDFDGTIGVLEAGGFTGTYVLELETHDVAEENREADALRSRELITGLLADAHGVEAAS
jgi:sugar phosphate isomerase/epimerase